MRRGIRRCNASPRVTGREFASARVALAVAPDDVNLKLGLANAFVQQGKNALGLVILEDLTKRSDAPVSL